RQFGADESLVAVVPIPDALPAEDVAAAEPIAVVEIEPAPDVDQVETDIVDSVETAETPDFSELLDSLESDAAQVAPSSMTPPPLYESMPDAAFDFDEELLREVAPTVEPAGVISTDSFLDDIGGGDIDFDGGLTDELSALTGVGRPSRPSASVNRIPESGTETLSRDTRVDRDTLLKIIDGIKSL
ncbi:MAG: hypothetical protein HGB10_04595, partial [Coriobacteriia bacterium]|nr:hypothetical protein [Coriobacteriia bacterium]